MKGINLVFEKIKFYHVLFCFRALCRYRFVPDSSHGQKVNHVKTWDNSARSQWRFPVKWLFTQNRTDMTNLFPKFSLAMIDWCCFYYFVRNSLVALLEALCARKVFNSTFWFFPPELLINLIRAWIGILLCFRVIPHSSGTTMANIVVFHNSQSLRALLQSDMWITVKMSKS